MVAWLLVGSKELICLSSLGLSAGTDLILELEGGQALMVEDLSDVSAMEVEMGVAEVHESDSSNEDDEPGVVTVASRVERIITDLITVGQVMDVVLFLPSVATAVG